jgi:GH24 family phage-related lysozyme (muramidase)
MRLYTGVVEDRMDPLKLGRCKVRVVGIHTEIKTVLPTADLPWAMPMQPLNSAAISGIGYAPVGPVEGTWVVVAFQDEDTQFPIIMGTLGGIPQKEGTIEEDEGTLSLVDPGGDGTEEQQNTVKHDKDGNQIREGITEVPPKQPKTTEKDQVVSGDTHGNAKPANQYTTISDKGLTLIKNGEGFAKKIGNNQVQAYPDPVSGGAPYTIGYGTTYIDGKPVQPGTIISFQRAEELFLQQIKTQYLPVVTKSIRAIVTQSMIDACTSLCYNMGPSFAKSSIVTNLNRGDYQAAANSFLLYNKARGPDGALKEVAGLTRRRREESELFLRDGIPGKGKSVTPNEETVKEEAIKSGDAKAEPTPPVGEKNSSGQTSTGTSDSGASTEYGFRDPNKKYPLYVNEPDTNRLARHEFIEKTVVFTKETQRLKDVKTGGGKSWDQSECPYNADYPFNKVLETESGHILEFDDTPKAERIHLYHKSGTFTEIDHNGTRVNRIIGDGYEIYERNGYVYLGGSLNITVNGDSNVLVDGATNLDIKGATNIRVYNDASISVGGNAKLNVAQNFDVKASNINLEATSAFNIKSGSGMNIQSGSGMNIKSGSTMNVDYSRGNFGQGASGASGASVGESIDKDPQEAPELSSLQVNTRQSRAAIYYETEDDDPAVREAFIQKEIDKGAIDPTQQQKDPGALAEEKVEPNKVQPKGANCDAIFGMSSFPATMKLSPNFTLGVLTKDGTRPLQPQQGLSIQEIACNLKGLAENCLEPIRKLYPGINITSGFRRPGDLPPDYKNEKSQHTSGQAADFVINGFNRKQMYEACVAISKVIPYDQLLLEYDGKTTVWIHVSFKYTGNRKQHFTMNYHGRISPIGTFLYIPENPPAKGSPEHLAARKALGFAS